MNAAHFHLMLNHVPVVGALFVVVLLGIALFRPSPMARTALGAAVVVGVVAVVVQLTGEQAEELVERLPDVTRAGIERHERAALLATVAMAVIGLASAGVLVWTRRRAVPRAVVGAMLAGAVVGSALMAWTANLGGQIRHTEIRGVAAASPASDSRDDDRR